MVDVNKEDYIMTIKLYIICGEQLEPSNIGYNLCVIYAKSMKDAIDIQLKHNEQSYKKTSIEKVIFVRQVHRSLQEKFIGECGISIDIFRDASINILEPYINNIIAQNYETNEEEDVDNYTLEDITKIIRKYLKSDDDDKVLTDGLELVYQIVSYIKLKHKAINVSGDDIFRLKMLDIINDIYHLK